MKYSFSGRIRYSETDRNSVLTFPSLFNYFQDTSTFHGEDNHISMSSLYERDLTWVLSGWQVRLFGMPKLGDPVTVTTWAYDFRRCSGNRNYTMADPSGRLYAAADTQYVLMHFEEQTPARITEDIVRAYSPESDAHLELSLPRKILPATDEDSLEPFPVQASMIDTNGHVNNAQYIKTAMLYLPENLPFNCFRAEYKQQAHLGDLFYPCVSEIKNGMQIKLYDAAHRPYFVGEWVYYQSQSGEDYAADR